VKGIVAVRLIAKVPENLEFDVRRQEFKLARLNLEKSLRLDSTHHFELLSGLDVY
jgi:hypothetical protein